MSDFDQIWTDVQANSKKLRECPGPHDFVQEGEGIRRMYRCSKCGGTVDTIRYYWYLEGLKHGRKCFPPHIDDLSNELVIDDGLDD